MDQLGWLVEVNDADALFVEHFSIGMVCISVHNMDSKVKRKGPGSLYQDLPHVSPVYQLTNSLDRAPSPNFAQSQLAHL